MADFPLSGYSFSETIGADTSISSGTSVTTGGANTKGSWVELSSSISAKCDLMIICVDFNGGSAIRDFAIDIGVGGAGSESVIVSDIATQLKGEIGPVVYFQIPIYAASGSRLSARASSNGSGDVLKISALLFSSEFSGAQGLAKVTSFGVTGGGNPSTVAVDAGGTANTKGAWTEIVASTSISINEFTLCHGTNTNNAHGDGQFLADIAIGGAGSEVIIAENIMMMCVNFEVARPPIQIQQKIPAGTRIAMRLQSTIIDPTDRVLSFSISGVS